MNWQINLGFVIFGILLIAKFAWRMTRRARLLGTSDIILLAIGVSAIVIGSAGLLEAVI